MAEKRPNILFLMGDQLAAPALPAYGHPVVKTPHTDRLAAEGVVFDNAYCNFPICAPSRFSMLSGRLGSRIGAYDNAAEFPSTVPTMAHYLRLAGYRTCLAGKMHFIGADQQHGFEERLTTDVYPADFGWTPDWEHPSERLEWFHNLVNVVEAGPTSRTLQIDFDEEVAYRAQRFLWDHARDADERPFFLLTSFSHPHDPYNIPREYWDRYDDDSIDLPSVPAAALTARDPHSRRLYENYDRGEFEITDDHVRRARRAYYGAISWLDDRIGALLQALEESGQADNTIIVLCSDHGDMLGERGMWFKMSFFEWACRVPLILHAPDRFNPARRTQNVSLVDLLPTLLELGGVEEPPAAPLDGTSLVPLAADGDAPWPDTVFGEYLAEGSVAPILMVRKGPYKYVACEADPPQLYDLSADPEERRNRAADPALAETEAELAALVAQTWDLASLTGDVIASQMQRRLVFRALMTGNRTLWDYDPPRDESKEYVRNVTGLYEKEARAFLPRRGRETSGSE